MKKSIMIIVCVLISSTLFSQLFHPSQDDVTKKWGYFDKHQKLIIPFKYDEASSFHLLVTYFAQVKRDNILYLIDTLGNEYLLAKEIKDLNNEIEALCIYTLTADSIPNSVFENKQLKILCFTGDYENKGKIVEISGKLGNLTNLTHLILACNQIATLPKEIGNLSNLLELNLDDNQLKKIPMEVGNLKSLKKLTISGNQLKTLPAEIGKLSNLKGLYLSFNSLKKLPAEIQNLKNLKILYLNGNLFKAKGKENLRNWLPGCEIIWEVIESFY